MIVGTFMNYEFTDKIDAYTELMFMDTQSRTQFGPAGNFFTGLSTNCGNPYLSNQQAVILGCTNASADDDTVTFLRADGTLRGAPVWEFRHTTYRGVSVFVVS